MDGSSDDNWQKQLNFVETVVKGLNVSPDQTRVGIITFSNKAKLHWDFNEYTVSLIVFTHKHI